MNMYFSWEIINGEIQPFCNSDEKNKDGVSLIACLLMDDGGLGYVRSISWLDEGILAVANVKSGKVESCEWSRETWGAFLQVEKVEIFSLYDESYMEAIDLERFEKILAGWREFVVSEPQLGVCTKLRIY